jgi:hypothetical protein
MDYKKTDFSKFGADFFPGLLGIEVLNVSTNLATAQMKLRDHYSLRMVTCMQEV